MNTQQLKELALRATPGPWYRSSAVFNGITCSSKPFALLTDPLIASASEKRNAEFIASANPATITILIDAIEASERERDELRAGHTEAAKVISTWHNRAKAAEAELARRDAAAGEAADRIVDDGCGQQIGGVGVSDRLNCVWPIGTKFYTAAPSAVLPPKLSMDIDVELQGEFRVHESIRRKGFNQALDAALELGAQPQKPVVLPGRYDIEEMSGDPWQSYRCIEPDEDGEYMRRDEVLKALDAAGVPYEVKP